MRIATLITTLILAMAPAFGAQIPRKAQEFVIDLPEGGRKLLSDYRGQVVLMEFMFTTCPHCQQSAQVMSRLQRDYGMRGFQALGVAFNPMSKMLIPDFIRDYKVTFPIGYSERDPVNAFLQNPPDSALHAPQLVFIDKKGMVRAQSLPRGDTNTGTEANMRKVIEQLLSEPGPAKPKPAASKKKTS